MYTVAHIISGRLVRVNTPSERDAIANAAMLRRGGARAVRVWFNGRLTAH